MWPLRRCVGFYHSRPTMPARPSLPEVKQQLQHQQEHNKAAGGFSPFVTAICTPFDPSAPAGEATSALNWIFVSSAPDRTAAVEPLDADCKAYTLEVRLGQLQCKSWSAAPAQIASLPCVHLTLLLSIILCSHKRRQFDGAPLRYCLTVGCMHATISLQQSGS